MLESSESALTALCCHISPPVSMFDKYEALELLQSLVRLKRNDAELESGPWQDISALPGIFGCAQN